MKSEERITMQRDWFLAQSDAFEGIGAEKIAEEFKLVAGTLDWVLLDD